MALRLESPLASGVQRLESSPPSPVLDLPPIRFIAIARDSCDSADIDPKLIAPVTNLLTISFAGSTFSISIEFPSLNDIRPRSVQFLVPSSLDFLENSQYAF